MFLKGQLSEGMLCSYFDLGMFHSDKIIECSQETSIGMNCNNYLSLKDNIIKVSVTSNRLDSLSILGLSRNIAAVNNLKILPFKVKTIPVVIEKKLILTFKIQKNASVI